MKTNTTELDRKNKKRTIRLVGLFLFILTLGYVFLDCLFYKKMNIFSFFDVLLLAIVPAFLFCGILKKIDINKNKNNQRYILFMLIFISLIIIFLLYFNSLHMYSQPYSTGGAFEKVTIEGLSESINNLSLFFWTSCLLFVLIMFFFKNLRLNKKNKKKNKKLFIFEIILFTPFLIIHLYILLKTFLLFI